MLLTILLLALGFGLLPPTVFAQGETGRLWHTFTARDGLATGNVAAVFVAQDGVLWFGTDAGVSRYNGTWRSWSAQDGLPPGRVRAIAQSADGTLWVASQYGLGRGSPEQGWSVVGGLPSDDVRALLATPAAADNGGVGVWAGTAQGLAYLSGDEVRQEEVLAGFEIVALASSEERVVYAGVAGQGVWRIGPGDSWQPLSSSNGLSGELYTLFVDSASTLWAGTQDGLFYHVDGAWQAFPLKATGAPEPAVFAIAEDQPGSLWVGTDQGGFHVSDLYTSDSAILQMVARDGGLVNDFVRALAIDQSGAVWLGTIAGVSRYDGNIWQRVREYALIGERVNAILTDRFGRTWVGTEHNGLLVWNGETWQQLTTVQGLPDNRVVSLFEGDERIWLGTSSGVGYLDETTGWHFFDESDGVSGLPVYAYQLDLDHALWMATQRGVTVWHEESGFARVPELGDFRVNAVHLGPDGALWFGGEDAGLVRLKDGVLESMETPEGTVFKGVVRNGIREGPDDALWLGLANDGLWRYADGQWTRQDVTLASPKVLTLASIQGSLWVGTRQGVSRYDGLSWQTYQGGILPAPEVQAVAPGHDGTLWLGTWAGLVHYRPEHSAPWVRVTSINLQPVENGEIRLQQDVLQDIRLVAGDVTTLNPDLVYVTQLETVDQTPRVHTEARITAYRDQVLPQGIYTLRVLARDAAFNYSQPSEIRVVVPGMVRLPGGLTMVANVFYPILALALLAVAGLTTAGSIGLRARERERRRQRELASRRREALARRFNPYISGEPVREPDMFFARDGLLRRILNALHQNSIMIHGDRRMGKTTLLYQLSRELLSAKDPEWVFVPVLVDLEGTPQEIFFHQLMEAIWGALQAYIMDMPSDLRLATVPAEEYTDRDFTADLRLVIGLLRQIVAPRKVRVVLLLDEMDVISGYDRIVQQQLRRIFMSSLANNLGAVVAGIQISREWDRVESPWYNLFNEIPLEPFTEEEARELLVEPVRGVYDWDPEAVAYVVAQAEGRPHRLQQYALEAVNHMLAANRTRITMEDVRAAEETIEWVRSH